MITNAKILLAAAVIFVGGPSRNVDVDEIKRAVELYVHSRLDSTTEQFIIEYRSLPSKVLNVPKDAVLRVCADGFTELRSGVLLPVEVVSNDHVEHTFLVSMRIRRYGRVLIALDKIAKREHGDMIAATEETIEITRLPSDIIKSYEALKGMRAKRMVKQGAVLTKSMFEKIPTVNQGSTVTLLVKMNSVVIKTLAIAREDGSCGDIVVVQKHGSGDRLKARVLDKNTVELLAQN